MRPVGVTGYLRLLPGSQSIVEVAQRFLGALLQPLDLVGNVDGLTGFGKPPQLENLAFEILNRFFEIQIIIHALDSS